MINKKLIKRIATGLCVPLFILGVSGKESIAVAGGNDKTAYERELEAADRKKTELEKAADELTEKIKTLDPDKTDMEIYILTVDNVYLDLFEEYTRSEKDVEEVKALVEASRQDLAEKRSWEEEKYRIMKDRIRYMYEEGKVSFSDVVFGSSGISDFFNRMEYRQRIMTYDNMVYSNYEEAREEAELSEKLLTARLDQLEALQSYRTTQLAKLEELAAKKATDMLAVSESLGIDSYALYSHWDELMDSSDVTGVLEIIHEEDEATYKLENMIWPLPGHSYISSHFGNRTAPTEGATIFHSGVDIPAVTGTEAKAALSGVVVAAAYEPASGNFVKINHGNGLYTTYCHASKLMVKTGDHVKQGQTVVLVGSTGVSTGPHLHFGVQIDGSFRNPLDYVYYGKE